MAFESYDLEYYNLGENEEEISLESEQQVATAAEAASVTGGSSHGNGEALGFESDRKDEVSPLGQEGYRNHEDGTQEGNLNPEGIVDPEGDNSDLEPREGDRGEPGLPATEVPVARRQRQQRRRRRQLPFLFTQGHVEVMESVFEETQYPDILTRRELARVLDVPEAKVEVWFNNRRAKQRKNERREMLRNMPSVTEGHIFMMDVEDP